MVFRSAMTFLLSYSFLPILQILHQKNNQPDIPFQGLNYHSFYNFLKLRNKKSIKPHSAGLCIQDFFQTSKMACLSKFFHDTFRDLCIYTLCFLHCQLQWALPGELLKPFLVQTKFREGFLYGSVNLN